MDGTARGCPRSPVASRYEDHLGSRFRHTRGNRPHSRLAHQFHGDSGVPIGIFQVKNQLGQVLDGVDVVVGRREIRVTPGVE